MKNPFDPGYFYSDDLRGFGFSRVGANVAIAKNCTIIAPENISIGDNVRIDANANARIIAAGGEVRLGSHIHIGGSCHIAGRGGVTMGDFSGNPAHQISRRSRNLLGLEAAMFGAAQAA